MMMEGVNANLGNIVFPKAGVSIWIAKLRPVVFFCFSMDYTGTNTDQTVE